MEIDNCRMYEDEFPKVDDVIMVNVRQIADMGAYVKLLEYGDRDGMILLSELSRRRIRSVQKLIRVGKNEVVTVLRVDEEKGYIDLSKRRVTEEDIAKCEDKYEMSKKVHSILRHVATLNEISLKTMYETIGWPLNKKFGHAYHAFFAANGDKEKLREFIGDGVEEKVIDTLFNEIRRKMTTPPVKIRSQLDLRCTGEDGINGIKKAIDAGIEAGKKVGIAKSEAAESDARKEPTKGTVKITYLAAPFYVVTVDSPKKDDGFMIINAVHEAIEDTLKKCKWGTFKIEKEAKVVSDTDDKDFAALMAQAEKENQLVGGDEDEGDAAAASDDDM